MNFVLTFATVSWVAIAIPLVLITPITLAVSVGPKFLLRRFGVPHAPKVATGRSAERLLAEQGVNADAVLVSFQEVGQQNFTPLVDLSLRITPADGDGFDVTLREQVEFSVIGRLAPGWTVGVRYVPADHSNIQMVGDFAAPGPGAAAPNLDDASAGDIATAVRAAGGPGHPAESAGDLLSSGQQMVATVREFSASGQTVGDLDPTRPNPGDPVYVFKVELPIPGASPIESTFQHRVPLEKVHSLTLGARLAVAVDPANPTRRVAIDWARSPVDGYGRSIPGS